jgi:hypothetical protein
MATQIDTLERDIVLVEDAHTRPMMGLLRRTFAAVFVALGLRLALTER